MTTACDVLFRWSLRTGNRNDTKSWNYFLNIKCIINSVLMKVDHWLTLNIRINNNIHIHILKVCYVGNPISSLLLNPSFPSVYWVHSAHQVFLAFTVLKLNINLYSAPTNSDSFSAFFLIFLSYSSSSLQIYSATCKSVKHTRRFLEVCPVWATVAEQHAGCVQVDLDRSIGSDLHWLFAVTFSYAKFCINK